MYSFTMQRVSFAQTCAKAPELRQNRPDNKLTFRHFPKNSRPTNSRGRVQVLAAVKKASAKNVVCSKTLVVKPGQEDQVEQMCRDIVQFSKDRMQDRSSGIHTFECSQDNWDKNVFHFWERYESNSHLGTHNTCHEYTTFMKKIQPHLEQPVGMALYEWRDGQLGNVCVQGGPKGEGGLDDATGASGSSGGASMKQTSSAVDLTGIKEDEDKPREIWGLNFKFPWQK